jgi:hypothetical protein
MRHCIKVMLGCVSSGYKRDCIYLCGDLVILGYLTLGYTLSCKPCIYWGSYYR